MNALKTSNRIKNTSETKVLRLCDVAKEFEDSGEYEAAARSLGDFWQGVGIRPEVSGLSDTETASLLTRAGALTGWIGSMKQVSDSQEMAKDLISEGANLFEKISDNQNWAESRSDLAVCYWREGAFDESRVILEDVLDGGVKFSPQLRGKILLRSVSVEISTKNYVKAAFLINQAASLIESKGNDLLSGKLHFYRALTLRGQGEDENRTDLLISAVEEYHKARAYYKKAKHNLFSANVENNLGNVYRLLHDFDKAHTHLDKAIYLYVKLKNQAHAALVYENKARAYIVQNNLADAEIAARASVDMVSGGDESSVLSESLTTLGVVLSRQGSFADAVHSFVEAKDAALLVGDTESAGIAVLTQIEELQSDLSPAVFRTLYLEANDLLKRSPRASTIERLQEVAKKQFEFAGKFASMFSPENAPAENQIADWENFSLPETVREYEGGIILQALTESGGRVTKAAKLLGLSHQNLSLILHQRHRELKQHCVQRKPRTVIKKKAN